MSKLKLYGGITALVLLLGGVGTGVYLIAKPKETTPSQASGNKAKQDLNGKITDFTKPQATVTPADPGKTYTDTSGFSFKYPTGFTITDVTPNDATYYSLLSLKNSSGEIKVTVKDTKYTTVDAWLKGDKTAPKTPSTTTATSLGALTAKSFTTTDATYLAAIDQAVLYLIESPKTPVNLLEAQKTVATSFALSQAATPTVAGTSGSTTDVTYEPDEIVQ